MTLKEARGLVSKENLEKLNEIVTTHVNINMSNKLNNDIIMSALCKAVSDGVIHSATLDDSVIKLLNSSTNTISPNKLGGILKLIRQQQPKICCVITLKNQDLTEELNKWVFNGENGVMFNDILAYVINEFDITPSSVRTMLADTLKNTIVNNMSQFVSKFQSSTDEEKKDMNVSINTINRLVNMTKNNIFAEFKPL